jgi:hypothetical protein
MVLLPGKCNKVTLCVLSKIHACQRLDLNVITRQTKESKRAGEILEGLKLGGANSKGSSDADDIPSTLSSDQSNFYTIILYLVRL